jgi:hypothetical protein
MPVEMDENCSFESTLDILSKQAGTTLVIVVIVIDCTHLIQHRAVGVLTLPVVTDSRIFNRARSSVHSKL